MATQVKARAEALRWQAERELVAGERRGRRLGAATRPLAWGQRQRRCWACLPGCCGQLAQALLHAVGQAGCQGARCTTKHAACAPLLALPPCSAPHCPAAARSQAGARGAAARARAGAPARIHVPAGLPLLWQPRGGLSGPDGAPGRGTGCMDGKIAAHCAAAAGSRSGPLTVADP